MAARLTWAGAVWVLGGLITLVMAVILTITLPLAGAQATPIGAAELIGATGWVLCVGEGGDETLSTLCKHS